jgi:hypothetical protein
MIHRVTGAGGKYQEDVRNHDFGWIISGLYYNKIK